MTPDAFLKLFAKQSLFAYDFPFSKLLENVTMHAVSMTPHARLIVFSFNFNLFLIHAIQIQSGPEIFLNCDY
jgi:hypothetical protein